MHFYSHNISDFNNSTRHLTRVERSVYRDAIDMYYDTELPLISDFDRLAKRLLCISDEEKNALQIILNDFFSLSDNGYTQNRCELEISKYRANSSAKAKAGIASATKRQLKSTHVQHNSTRVQQTVNEIELTNNQELITNNCKPITKKNIKVKNIASDDELFSGIDQIVVRDFKAMRLKKRAAITQTAINGIRREAEKAGISLEDALRICCERDWRGFKADWILSPAHAPPLQTASEKRKSWADNLTGKSNGQQSIIDIN